MGRLIAGALLIGATCVALLSFTGEAGSQEIGTPLPRAARAPADNPTTPAKVSLGRLLFWDPMLSGPRDVACATCHHPQFGYAENRDLSIGVTGAGLGHRRRFSAGSAISPVKRNSQTILNVAFNGSDVIGPTTDASPITGNLHVGIQGYINSNGSSSGDVAMDNFSAADLAVGNPKGPFGNPFSGPFGGPI